MPIVHSVEDKDVADRSKIQLPPVQSIVKEDDFTKSRRTKVSITINSNMAASYSALNMKRANSLLTKSLQRLSSGSVLFPPRMTQVD